MTGGLRGGSPILEVAPGRCYVLHDRPGTYEIVQLESATTVVVREVGRGTLISVPTRLLQGLISSENMRDRDLVAMEPARLKAAEGILEDIRPLLAYRRIPKAVLEERAGATGRSMKSLRFWLGRYRKDPRLSSLCRKRRADIGSSQFHPAVEKAIADVVQSLMHNGGLRLVDAHEELSDAVKALRRTLDIPDLPIPSYGTLYNRYHEISERDKATARLGKRAAKLLHGIAQGSLSDVNHPLALVQVDHLELPVMVVDEEGRIPIGKGWITVLIDLFSRCVCGFYVTLEAPGNLSLGLAMSHAILPKDDTLATLPYDASWPIHGFMWSLHADNAGEFHGNMLELAAREYRIDLMFRKVKHPNYGGAIESYLGTLSGELRKVPGSTREGPAALGDYDPSEAAVMTLAELERYVLNLIIEYHNRPHSGIDKMTPLGRFTEGLRGGAGATPVGRLRQATDPARLRLDFLPCDERCVHPKGIVWDKVWYVDDCLQRWVNAIDPANRQEKRKFLVRRDPRDLSRIYFWDPEEHNYRVIGTRNLSRPSITLWELQGISRYLAAKGHAEIDEETIFAAREDRRRTQEQAQARTAKAQRQRARQKERERRAVDGARIHQEATRKSTAPATTVETPTRTSSPKQSEAFEFDWEM